MTLYNTDIEFHHLAKCLTHKKVNKKVPIP